ncbi:hypothetical protein Tco_0968444 [Tanacetum coccineum]
MSGKQGLPDVFKTLMVALLLLNGSRDAGKEGTTRLLSKAIAVSLLANLQLLHMELFGPTSSESVIPNEGQQKLNQNAEVATDDNRERSKKGRKLVFYGYLERLKKTDKSASPYVGTFSCESNTCLDEDDSEIPPLKDNYKLHDGIFTTSSFDDVGCSGLDFTSLETGCECLSYTHIKDSLYHPRALILGDPNSASSYNRSKSQHEQEDFRKLLEDERWVDAMQEEIVCSLEIQTVWVLVDLLMGRRLSVSKGKSWCDELLALMQVDLVSSMGERSMIGSLMYLTASRPDIMFAVCACSRFQVTPKTSHLSAVKRIFRYLKGKPKLGLWYPRVSSFDLESYSDSDYAGANLDRKSTTGGCQFLGRRLISWQCKKQTIVATSTTEAEYVAAASCCGQVLWIQNQMLDYGFNFMNTKIYIDNESTICIVKNPVYHSKTKHIAIRHHFIRDAYEKKLIQVLKIHTDDNVADLLTKAFDVSRSCISRGLKEFRELLSRVTNGTEALLLPTLFFLWLDKVSTASAKHLDAKKKFVMYPRFISIFLGKQLVNVPVPLDHFPVNTLTSKVFSFMVKKGKHFSGKVTPLFATMLVQPTQDEGASSERPSEAQPTPSPAPTSEVPHEPQTDSSPAHTSEVPLEQQTDPSPRPSPTTTIPDSIPETSGGNLGGHSSSDKSLSGNEGEMTLQSVYDLCLSLCAQVSDQAKEIQHLKAQIKKLKKQAKPVIHQHRAWLKSVSLKQRLTRKSFPKKQRVHKESVSKQGRKFAKGESSVQRDPLFDEIPEDTVDHMETENAQDEGRTRDIVDEDKEIEENVLSTEDVLSTDKEGVSTDMEKVSTDRLIVSTDGSKVSTDRQNKGTKEHIEGTEEQVQSTDGHKKGTEEEIANQPTQTSTQTHTSTIFGDDETIAKVLLNMSQAKAVSREKEKGVELKDIEEVDRPRPTSTRSLLTLKHLPKIDPKHKGKKKIEEEDESESEDDDIPQAEKKFKQLETEKKFKQLESDEELARKVQEEWEAEEERNRIAEENAANEELIKDFDDIKARIEADRLLAEKLQEQEREQFTIEERAKFLHDTIAAQENLYEKIKRSDEDFISIGSAEDERLIKRMNEKGVDLSKSEVIKEESKEEVQEEDKDEESTRKRKLGTRKKMKSRKRRYIQYTSEDDSEKEIDELRLYLTIAQDEEKEVDYEILDRKYPIKEWKTECLGAKPQTDQAEHLEEINLNVVIRSNGQKRYFSTLMTVLSIFDREDLNAVYQLVMEKYQDEMPEGFDRVLWGDLMIFFNSDDKDEFWSSQLDWIIKKYPLKKEVLKQMLKLKLESEEESTMALELIKFVKKILIELESEEHKNWLVHKQTAYGKDFSNPFMVDNLPKIVRFSTHLASVVKSWLVHDQTVHALASPKANELTIPEQTATGKGTSNPLMAGYKDLFAGPNLEHTDAEATDATSQPQPGQMDEEFTATAYPNIQENLKLTVDDPVIPEEPASSTGTLSSLQHLAKDFSFGDQFFNDKPPEANNEKATADTEAESMVSVTIHQDTSAIPPMTSPVIDLVSVPDSPTVHRPLPTTTTTTATTTTTIMTTIPLPPQPQQVSSDSILINRLGELEQHIADLVDANQALEERLDKHGSRLYRLENQDIPNQVSKAVDEIVTDAVDWAMHAPLRERFRDLPEADMKEILHNRMWESKSYQTHKDHMTLKKKKKRQGSPKTPSGSPPHPPPPPPPPAGPSGTSGASGASGSSQSPPPPPPPSNTQGGQSTSTAAPSSSKTAASAKYMAWTMTDTRIKPSISPIPEELHTGDDTTANEQAYSSSCEDVGRDHIPTVNLRHSLCYEVYLYTSTRELTQIGDMATFMDWYCKKQGISELTQKDLEGPAYKIVKVFHPDVVHLQFQMEECHKFLIDQVDDAILRRPAFVNLEDEGLPLLSLMSLRANGTDQMWIVEEDMQAWMSMRCMVYLTGGFKDNGSTLIDTHLKVIAGLKEIVLVELILKEYVIANKGSSYISVPPSDFEICTLLNLQDKRIRIPVGFKTLTRRCFNLTKPRWDAKGFEYKHDFTICEGWITSQGNSGSTGGYRVWIHDLVKKAVDRR